MDTGNHVWVFAAALVLARFVFTQGNIVRSEIAGMYVGGPVFHMAVLLFTSHLHSHRDIWSSRRCDSRTERVGKFQLHRSL